MWNIWKPITESVAAPESSTTVTHHILIIIFHSRFNIKIRHTINVTLAFQGITVRFGIPIFKSVPLIDVFSDAFAGPTVRSVHSFRRDWL